MEFYDLNQIQQLAPFVALNLGDDDVSLSLKKILDRNSVHHEVWNNSMLKNRLLETKFILRYFESESAVYKSVASCKAKGSSTHAIESPFHPESDLYPNGILSSNWFSKYINKLPFAVISVHHLNPNRNHDGELGATLAAFKAKYLKFGVRYVALLVSSGKDTDEENNRIDVLRQISELSSKNGLFYLNKNPQNFEKDCDVLVPAILSSLKPVAAEFYTAAESRIKQRYGKYYTIPAHEIDTRVELSPKILEVRNLIKRAMLLQFIHPNNVDHSLPILESAYEGLVELLRNLQDVFFSPNVNTHDLQLYSQYRTLLDVIAIHLIRGYFSIEEPIASLRKHQAHIENVLDLLHSRPETEQRIWEAIQYQWLAELMCALPTTALTDLSYNSKPKAKINSRSLIYFGGISFHDNFYSQVVTDPCLVFMKAAAKIETVTKMSSDASYPPIFLDLSSLHMHRINLLKMAENLQLENALLKNDNEGLRTLLNWQIAEGYEKVGNNHESLHHYSRVLSEHSTQKWGSIERLVVLKIVSVLEKIKETGGILKWLPRLFSLKNGEGIGNPLDDTPLEGTHDIVTESRSTFFGANVLVYNKTLGKEFYVFDTIVLQLSLTKIVNDDVLASLFPECEITYEIKSIEISLTDDLNIILSSTGVSTLELEVVQIDDDSRANFGGRMTKSKKVIQFERDVARSGWFGIESLKSKTVLNIEKPGLSIKYVYNDDHELNLNDVQQTLKLISLAPNGSLVTKCLMPEPQTATKIFARPYKPNVKLIRKMTTPLIIVGEKLSVPFVISHKPLTKKLDFTSVTIELQTYVKLNLGRRDDMTVQSNWESLKDDQPMHLLEFLNSGEHKCTKTLQICVRGPRHVEDENSPLFVVLVARIVVKELSGDEAIHDLDEYQFYVAITPFKSKITIGPSSDTEGQLLMPSPFILNLESEAVQKHFSMPLPLRSWVVKGLIDDYLKLIENGEIMVTLVGVQIKSDNPDAIISKSGDATVENGIVTQLFTTESTHRFPHRNLNISTVLSYDWKRQGSESINHFEPSEIQSTLPLQDPRVLMQVDAKENDMYGLTYTIENPTPRILTFTASLDTQLAAAEGTSWLIDELLTVSPPKQTPFPVLPFSQFVLEYTGTFDQKSKGMPVVLPLLHVYDVNYKVSLPTLSIDDHVLASGTGLVLKI